MSESKTPRVDAPRVDALFAGHMAQMRGIVNAVERHALGVRQVTELLDLARALESELTRLSAEKAEVERERNQHLEWRQSVLGKIRHWRTKDGFEHDWSGNKDGWGFCFEWIEWVARRAEAAEAALLQAREDAQRYRWLRENDLAMAQFVSDATEFIELAEWQAHMDAAIDAARQAQEGEKG